MGGKRLTMATIDLEKFLFPGLLITAGIYLVTPVAWTTLRYFYAALLTKVLGVDEEIIVSGVFAYLGNEEVARCC